MDAAPSNWCNWHCSRFKEQESILGFRRRIRSENFSGSSSFSSRSLRAKRRRKPACTASFPSYDGASVHILAISSFTETDHRLSYSCRTGRAQGSLGYTWALYQTATPPLWASNGLLPSTLMYHEFTWRSCVGWYLPAGVTVPHWLSTGSTKPCLNGFKSAMPSYFSLGICSSWLAPSELAKLVYQLW